MTVSIVKLFPTAVLSTTAETLFTMPANPASSVLKNGRLCVTNNDTAARTVSLYTAAAATAASCFVAARSLQAGETAYIDVPTLGVGDLIVGKASAGAVVTVHEAGGVLYS